MAASSARLHGIAGHLGAQQGDGAAAGGAAPSPASAAPAAQQRRPQLFTDAQMRDYLRQGFAVLPVTDVPAAVHEQIYRRCKQVDAENPGNDVLERVPELQQVFDTPLVSGALRSVLGEGYAMHRHRYLHSSSKTDQVFHKDSHW